VGILVDKRIPRIDNWAIGHSDSKRRTPMKQRFDGRCLCRLWCEILEDRLPPGDLLSASGISFLSRGSEQPAPTKAWTARQLTPDLRAGDSLTDLSRVAEEGSAVQDRTRDAAVIRLAPSEVTAASRSGLADGVLPLAWSADPVVGDRLSGSAVASSTGPAMLLGGGASAEWVAWGHALAALDQAAADGPSNAAGLWAGLDAALAKDDRGPTVSERTPLAFDPASGWLAIWGEETGDAIRERLNAGGFLEVTVGGQVHSSDPASVQFDPALAGAGRQTLTGIRVDGGSPAPLELAAQTLNHGLAVQTHGPVTVAGTIQSAGRMALAGSAISVRGQLQATAVDLAAAGLVSVTARGTVTAGQVSVTAGVFIDAGQVEADGLHGGQIRVQAGNMLQGGRLSADGTAADGGTVQVDFDGSYIGTARAVTSADGVHGGQVMIDGSAAGRLFSSGTQEARGRTAAGGTVTLAGGNVALVGATADASGRAGGGTVMVGPAVPDAGHDGTVLLSATDLRAAALRGGSDGQAIVSGAPGSVSGFHLVDPHPTRAGAFGFTITPLTNGNVVVTDPHDNFAAPDGGAVYLFQGQTGALLGNLVGSKAGDRLGDSGPGPGDGPSGPVGDSVVPLTNGNYVVGSPRWNNNRGAATWGDGTVGTTGTVDDTDSLVGSQSGDSVGGGFVGGITALSNGNYVVATPGWNGGFPNGLGAVTWGDGTTGVTGTISAANSLVGSQSGDAVGYGGITALSNGNYVVRSPFWNGGLANGLGAVTWGDGTIGVTGIISAANSLVGSQPGDLVGAGGITGLSNGNYVVSSQPWNSGRGAATWADGTAGITGLIDDTNSLVGSQTGDNVGGVVTALTNGNFVVRSPNWDGGSSNGLGAVTWGDGTAGTTGLVSAANSLIGNQPGDHVGSGGITALTNGNYVVASPTWSGGFPNGLGAVTWGDGAVGTTGIVDGTNSLVGSQPGDNVGIGGVTALTNGNYVVRSQYWSGGQFYGLGAVTWGNGTVGVTGPVTAANSLVGSRPQDQVGDGFGGGITALSNGNYVVDSSFWGGGMIGGRGEVTWGDGTTGVAGPIDDTNSLVGIRSGDMVGSGGVTALSNGNYVIASPSWNGGRPRGIGAATWADGTIGITGFVDDTNSLVGSQPGDNVGSGVTGLSNGNYVVYSASWNGGLGAATWADGTIGITGLIGASNSLVGGQPQDNVGRLVRALSNGNYVVASPGWNGNRGAATWADGTVGITGSVDDTNSLVGSESGDRVAAGYIGGSGVSALPNGNYVVASPSWDNNRGAATWGDGSVGITGPVDDTNSLVG
jgi:hypothetical protein